jgi:hypothetical protein
MYFFHQRFVKMTAIQPVHKFVVGAFISIYDTPGITFVNPIPEQLVVGYNTLPVRRALAKCHIFINVIQVFPSPGPSRLENPGEFIGNRREV